MNNRELIEQVKIFGKMMKGRFEDLLKAENNMYVSYAREKQRRMELEAAQSLLPSEAGSPMAARIAGKLQQRESQIDDIHTQLTQLQETLIEGLQAPMNDTFSNKIEYLQRQVADLKAENRDLHSQLLEQVDRANDFALSVSVADDATKLRLSEIDRALADS